MSWMLFVSASQCHSSPGSVEDHVIPMNDLLSSTELLSGVEGFGFFFDMYLLI